jgi:hypothetical protein
MLIPFGVFSAAGAGGGGGSAGAYEQIATTILGSNQATISFASIAQTYKHLQIRYSAKSNSTTASGEGHVRLQGAFNSNSTDSNYAIHVLRGVASNPVLSEAETSSRKGFGAATRNAGNFCSAIIEILDYASTSKNTTTRTFWGYNGSTASQVGIHSLLFNNTAAVTSIDITTEDGSSFVSGSRFSLYGIKG